MIYLGNVGGEASNRILLIVLVSQTLHGLVYLHVFTVPTFVDFYASLEFV